MDAETIKLVASVAGIAGIGLLVFYYLYRPLIDLFSAKFPSFTRKQATWIISAFMGLVFASLILCAVVYLAPSVMEKIYERAVDLVLRDPDNKALSDKFSFRYKIGDRAFQPGEGQNGIASITGVPWGVKALSIEVSYPGYDQVPQDNPYQIKSGIVTVKMVPAQKLKPKTTSRNAPQIPTFTEAEKADFSQSPKVAPSMVTFWRRNLTAKPLALLLYDCTESEGAPMAEGARSTGGRLSTWPLKMGKDGEFSKPFSKGNGCFYLWVRDESDEWPLGVRKLFDDVNAYVTIRETGEKDRPYSGDFSSWSPEINVPQTDDAAASGVRKSSSGPGSDSDQE